MSVQAMRDGITAEQLRNLVSYDSTTGELRWLIDRKLGKKDPHKEAGSIDAKGYRILKIDGVSYKAHRLAWLHYYGVWPHLHIDHIDQNPLNNAIKNLRCVSRETNMQNISRARSDSKTGFAGIKKNGSGYTAYIRVNGVRKSLGTYKTPEEAHQIYKQAKLTYHPGATA